MKPADFLRLLRRLIAVPAAWFIAVAPSSATAHQQHETRPQQPSLNIPSDRLATLRSLLGAELVPRKSGDERSAASERSPMRVAGPNVEVPPPPPPPEEGAAPLEPPPIRVAGPTEVPPPPPPP